ncbi:hypothetical protein JCM10213_004678 [Rhodosporidiobolus nylandii]
MSGVSPYHDAPGANITPPPGCRVTAAAFLIRHSSIYANDDEWEEYMKPFAEKVRAAQKKGTAIRSSSPLGFLSHWKSPVDDDNVSQLTRPGAEDAYAFGQRFRKLYSPLLPPKDLGRKGKKGKKAGGKIKTPFKVWTASSARDIGTAKAWIQGAFPHWQEGDEGEGDGKVVSLVEVPNKDPDWSISLTPHKICDAFSKEPGQAEARKWLETFGPPALERMKRFAPGVDWELKDVIAAQLYCGYESVVLKERSSPFCSTELFTQDEWRSHGYWHDLHWHHSIGYGAKISPYLGIGWLNASTHNLVSAYSPPHPHPNTTTPPASSGLFSFPSSSDASVEGKKEKKKKGKNPSLPPPDAPPDATHTQLLFPYFTHREEPPFALVALGLWNTSTADLPSDRMPQDRLWKTSHVIPFLGHVALEALSCTKETLDGEDEAKDWIRVLVNGAPQKLPECQDGPGGSCAMKQFEAFVARRVEEYKDFEGACKEDDGESAW